MAFSNYLSNISPQYTAQTQQAAQQIPGHATQQNQQLYAAYAYQQQMLMQQQQQQPQAGLKVPYQVAPVQIAGTQAQGVYPVGTVAAQPVEAQVQQAAYQAYANPAVQGYTAVAANTDTQGAGHTEPETVGWESVKVSETQDESHLGKRARPDNMGGDDRIADVAQRSLKVSQNPSHSNS